MFNLEGNETTAAFFVIYIAVVIVFVSALLVDETKHRNDEEDLSDG